MSCGICGSTNTRGGSWTPTRCLNCGAMEGVGEWYYDLDSRPTIEEIREKSGYRWNVRDAVRQVIHRNKL